MQAPFQWGSNGPKTAAQVARDRAVAAALAQGMGTPQNLGEGLASIGKALAYRNITSRADEAETAGQAAVAEALRAAQSGGSADGYLSVLSDPFATPQQSAVAQALYQRAQEEADPLRQLQLKQAQLDYEQDLNPPAPLPEYSYETIFDPETGREQRVGISSADPFNPVPLGGVQAPKDPLVTVNTGDLGGGTSTKKFQEEMGSQQGKRYSEIQSAGEAANVAASTLGLMEQYAQNPSFYSGLGGEQVLALKRLGASLGIGEGVESMEAFNALSKQAALASMGGSLGSGFSNADRSFVEDQVPNLGNTAEGNLQLIGIQRAIAQRKMEIARLATDYVQRNGVLDAGFDKEAQEYAEAHPLFPDKPERSGEEGWTEVEPGIRIRKVN